VGLLTCLYRLVLYMLRFAAHVRLMSEPAFRLAQNNAEKVSVMRFATKLVLYRAAAVIARFLEHAIECEDTSLTLQGIKYCVGVNSHETALFGEIYRDHGYEKVADFVPKEGWTIVDIGANVGIFAVRQALCGAHVYAFEPNPACYRRLTWTIDANELGGKIKPFNLAVAATSGKGKLLIEKGFTLGGTIVPHEGTSTDSQPTVQICSLDDVVPTLSITRINLLKIDTEGAEVDVLRGAEQTLKMVDRIILEYHSRALGAQVTALLHNDGFVLVRQDEQDSVIGRGVLYARKGAAI
jgi:FkbM family methyltransferase